MPFVTAVDTVAAESKHIRQFTVESMSLDDFKMSGMTFTNLVDWLLESHIHFIICHIHQGMENTLWSIEDIYTEIQRLRPHPGFPNGDQVTCPIFKQDKFEYLNLLPSYMTMPTHKIDLAADMDMNAMEEVIKR